MVFITYPPERSENNEHKNNECNFYPGYNFFSWCSLHTHLNVQCSNPLQKNWLNQEIVVVLSVINSKWCYRMSNTIGFQNKQTCYPKFCDSYIPFASLETCKGQWYSILVCNIHSVWVEYRSVTSSFCKLFYSNLQTSSWKLLL